MERPMGNGWFAVAWSDEIPVGGVEPLLVSGREYVLYRDEVGAPHVLDAHCRHLGAHLGYGGVVEGTGLRCPFHGWCWQPDGTCSDVPYSTTKKVPAGARIGSWPAADCSGVTLARLGEDRLGVRGSPSVEREEAVLDDDALLVELRKEPASDPGLRVRFRTEASAAELEARLFELERARRLFGVGPEGLTCLRAESGSMLLQRAGKQGISAFITPLDARRLDVRVAANVDGDGSALRAWQEELRVDISGLEGVVT